MKLPQGIVITHTERTANGLVLTVQARWWYIAYLYVKLHTIHALIRLFRLKRLAGYSLRESE